MKARFRITGKKPELWHPEDGRREELSYDMAGRVTTVDLQLEPNDAVFVVFREETDQMSLRLPDVVREELMEVGGPWALAFQEGRRAPEQIRLEELVPG
ncbi:MAG: hypothetical protein R2751_19010 [Bacteroidales bacterium]